MRKNSMFNLILLLSMACVSCQNPFGFSDRGYINDVIGNKKMGNDLAIKRVANGIGNSNRENNSDIADGEIGIGDGVAKEDGIVGANDNQDRIGFDVVDNQRKEPAVAIQRVVKLTKEDINKLETFVKNTSEYSLSLITIYNDNVGFYNDIKVYSGCSDTDGSGCNSKEQSEARNKAVSKLSEQKLADDFKKLAGTIKSYDAQDLKNKIHAFSEAIKTASSSADATKPEDKQKDKGLMSKAIRDARLAGKAYSDIMDSAIKTYIDALAAVTTSSSEFNTAVDKFVEVARPFATKYNVVAISAIDYAIEAIVLQKDVNGATDHAKIFVDETGQAFSYAIEALNVAYKAAIKTLEK
ncbi:hypothetical protein CR532_04490 (plasmid) [Candidatus Borreliella tachyglossi]|uniref:Lipoprotein n=1 Tax=Candidatus Borreliella tachyglossi TaxID=1964448 RepID=A0A2S1LY89_9SPIR|nr:hypothetical protein [Candidatus Borreliella tachyglossi]AWG43258.1 hypothetical protein CR532_04490 [Candidatus Borreliella tachyglossi]